jgi:hypothetical protein
MLVSLTFTAEETRAQTPRSETITQAATALRTSGCVLLRDVFLPEFIGTLREAFFARHESLRRGEPPDGAGKVGNRRFQTALDLSSPFDSPPFYANGLALPILRAVLGEEMVLGCFGAVTSLPGAQDQHVHRDGPPLFNKAVNRMVPAHALDLFVPLVELNSDTGTTRLYPGTHTNADLDPAVAPFVDPVVPVGSCLLIDYRLFHQGRGNRSQQVRPLLYCVYHQPWFKDYKNHAAAPFLRISDSDYAAIPAEHRKLLSWTEHYRTGLY